MYANNVIKVFLTVAFNTTYLLTLEEGMVRGPDLPAPRFLPGGTRLPNGKGFLLCGGYTPNKQLQSCACKNTSAGIYNNSISEKDCWIYEDAPTGSTFRTVANYPEQNHQMAMQVFKETDGRNFVYAAPGGRFKNKLYK